MKPNVLPSKSKPFASTMFSDPQGNGYDKKKRNYKSKTNRIPLRDKLRQEQEGRELEEAERLAHIKATKANRMLAQKQRKLREVEKVSKKEDLLGDKPQVSGSNYVTLTQDQLASILSTITKVQGGDQSVKLNINADNVELEISKDKQDKTSSSGQENVLNLRDKSRTKNTITPDVNEKGATQSHDTKRVIIDTKDKENYKEQTSDSRTTTSKDNTSLKSFRGDDTVFSRRPTKVVVVENNNKHTSPSTQHETQPHELSPRQKQLLIPKAHMTKGELKRLQWDLEKEAQLKLNKENDSLAQMYQAKQMPKYDVSKTSYLAAPSQNSHKDKTKSDVIEPSFIPGLGDMTSTNKHQLSTQNQRTSPRPVVMPKFLTKTELKRLQWEKERDAKLPDYNPWGRPAPGVQPPVSTNSAQKQPISDHPVLNTKQAEVPALNLSGVNDHQNYKSMPNSIPEFGNPSTFGIQQQVDHQVQPTQQPPLTKAEMLKIRWAQERAVPVEEYNPYGKPGAGAPIRTDSGTVLTDYHSRLNHVMRMSTEKPLNTSHVQDPQPVPNSAPTVRQYSEEIPITTRDHRLGALVNMDPIAAKEYLEKKKKYTQYQDDIIKQMEEKHLLKQEELKRKRLEEAEHESKLQQERQLLEQQYEEERKKSKQIQANQQSRLEAQAEAIAIAQYKAEVMRARDKLEKLQRTGHDISNLKAAYEEKLSPRYKKYQHLMSLTPTPSYSPVKPNNLTESNSQATVEPTSVPGLSLSPREPLSNRDGDVKSQAVVVGDEFYTSRTLTPSMSRMKQTLAVSTTSPFKEFGVQTEVHLDPNQQAHLEPDNLHSKTKFSNMSKSKRPVQRKTKVKEQMPWGYINKEGKRFVVQSERDPYYQEKRNAEAERKGKRKDILLRQIEANSKHIPTHTNYRTSQEGSLIDNNASPRGLQYKKTVGIGILSNTQKAKDSPSKKSEVSQIVAKPAKDTSKQMSTQNHPKEGYNIGVPKGLSISPTDDFVPFLRSDEVLSPTKAAEPHLVSREATQQKLAREAYYKTMQPAQYGQHMHNIRDQLYAKHDNAYEKDPLFHPELLTKHPTDRQQQVLAQLRQMRQGLMAKQREIESFLDNDELAERQPYGPR